MQITMPGIATPTAPLYQVEYRKTEDRGAYYLDGIRLKRVTTVLEKFPDSGQGLLKWARRTVATTADRALRDRVRVNPATGKRMCYFPEEEIGAIAAIAYDAPERIKTETANVGTDVHAFIDEWLAAGATEAARVDICQKYLLPANPLLAELLQRQSDTEKMTDVERNLFYDQMKSYMFDRFVRFWWASGFTYVGGEIVLGSRKWKFGGRLDILARDKRGRLVLLDFKTSKWVSPQYFAQVAAYMLAYEEQYGEKIHRCYIVQCPREWCEANQGFGVYPVKTTPYKNIFLFILKTWEYTEFKAADCRREKI